MIQYALADLRRYAAASRVSGYAQCALVEFRDSDPETIDAKHQEARLAIFAEHAAMVALKLDPVIPHPTQFREVWDQIDKAGLSPVKFKKRNQKNGTPIN